MPSSNSSLKSLQSPSSGSGDSVPPPRRAQTRTQTGSRRSRTSALALLGIRHMFPNVVEHLPPDLLVLAASKTLSMCFNLSSMIRPVWPSKSRRSCCERFDGVSDCCWSTSATTISSHGGRRFQRLLLDSLLRRLLLGLRGWPGRGKRASHRFLAPRP